MNTINAAHAYAVYEYTDKVSDPYYIGKRFISAHTPDEPASDHRIVVATANTVEECQTYLDHSVGALVGWLAHQDAQTGGALSRMMESSEESDMRVILERLAALRADAGFAEAASYLPELGALVDQAECVLAGEPFDGRGYAGGGGS